MLSGGLWWSVFTFVFKRIWACFNLHTFTPLESVKCKKGSKRAKKDGCQFGIMRFIVSFLPIALQPKPAVCSLLPFVPQGPPKCAAICACDFLRDRNPSRALTNVWHTEYHIQMNATLSPQMCLLLTSLFSPHTALCHPLVPDDVYT